MTCCVLNVTDAACKREKVVSERNVAYFPENDYNEEEQNRSADDGESDDPERDLTPDRPCTDHRHERLHLHHSNRSHQTPPTRPPAAQTSPLPSHFTVVHGLRQHMGWVALGRDFLFLVGWVG